MRPEDIPASWRAALAPILASESWQELTRWIAAEEAAGQAIYPPRGSWFRALELTPLDTVKVVILGQDPYHGPDQAMGLAFSVPDGVRQPPSLVNILKELESDCGIARRSSGDLSAWARQGVLLLNTSLTVASGRAGSHAGRGWEVLTQACLAAVASRSDPCVFMLWGNHAQATAARVPIVPVGRHCVLTSAHPSPLSAYRGFFGSRPFSRANAFLIGQGCDPVHWGACC